MAGAGGLALPWGRGMSGVGCRGPTRRWGRGGWRWWMRGAGGYRRAERREMRARSNTEKHTQTRDTGLLEGKKDHEEPLTGVAGRP